MSGTTQGRIQWLVRKNKPQKTTMGLIGPETHGPSSVVVLGPYVTDQVQDMLRQGLLDADDELCPENSYWFALHEAGEVKRFLGIGRLEFPSPAGDEESTQPDLEVDAQSASSVALSRPETTAVFSVKRASLDKSASSEARAAAAAEELANRFQRVGLPPGHDGELESEQTRSSFSSLLGFEKSHVLGALIIAAFLLAAIGVAWVIRSLRA